MQPSKKKLIDIAANSWLPSLISLFFHPGFLGAAFFLHLGCFSLDNTYFCNCIYQSWPLASIELPFDLRWQSSSYQEVRQVEVIQKFYTTFRDGVRRYVIYITIWNLEYYNVLLRLVE